MKKQPKLFIIIKQNLLSRKVLVFTACLFLSALFWVINGLNRTSKTLFHVPVTFTNLPKDKVLVGELPKELQLEVKGSGMKLFFLSMKKSMDELVVDFSTLKKLRENVYAFSPGNNYYLGKMIGPDLEVERVKPDSLFFAFNNSYYRSIPVKPEIMVDFEQMYNLAGKVKANPSYVVLSGDSNLIRKIDTIYTEKVILSSLNKSVKQKARLILPEETGKNLFSSSNEVMLEINVDKFTDAEFDVPLEVLNIPAGKKIKTFPDKVKIRFQVGMESYEKVSPSQFRVVVDFKNVLPKKNYLKIELLTSPSIARNVKLIPEKAEFLFNN